MRTRRAVGVAATAAVVGALAAGCATGARPGGSVAAEWTAVPDGPLSARRSATAAWVADRFVVVGGWSDRMCPPNADCVLDASAMLRDGAAFDPAGGAWEEIAPAPVPVAAATTAVVGDTLYLLVPDLDGDREPSFLAYDAATDTWATPPPPPDPWVELVTAGDTLLAIAGSDEYGPAADSVLDPAAGTWRTLPDDPLGPSFDRTAVWLGDRLLLAAKDLVPSPGSTEPSVVRLAELDGDLREWSSPRDTEVLGWRPVAVADRVVWPELGGADGGEVNSWGREYPFGGVLDTATGAWTPLPDVGDEMTPSPLSGVVVGGRVVVGDGLLDAVTGDWAALPGLPEDLAERAVATNDDALFVWGGATLQANASSGCLLRP